MRGRSETVPRPFASVRNPPRNRGCFSRSGRTVCIEKYNISRSGYLPKFHQVLRLPLKVPLELHQVLRLPRKVTLELHQVLRLPRKVTLDLHQVLRLPRKVTLDLHQVLRLPHRMTRRLDPRHIWNVISNARRNKCHPPNSPNTAPATQNDHPTSAEICGKQLKRHFQCAADPRPFRDRSEHDPRPFASVRNPPRNRGYFSRSGRTVCIEKYNISRSGYLSKFHQVLRLPRKVTLELHQVLRLPRKLTLELHQVLRLPRKVTLDLHQVLRLPHRMTRRLDPRHIWNVISNARRNKCHPPNSPNTAPATQNDHPTSGRNLRKTAETSFPMRGRSETVPRPFRAWSETVCVSPQPATQPRLLFALRTNGLYWKIQHFALRLSFQISPSPAPTTKSATWTSPSTAPTTQSDTWTSPSTAPTTKSDTWPSPSTAPATQNDSQAWSSSHMKRHFQCAQKQMSPSKLTKYCACHAKWPSNICRNLRKTAETSFPMRGRSETVPRPFRAWSETVCVSPQPATQPRLLFALRTNGLYWKIQHFALRLSFQISPSPAPTTQSDTWTSPSTAPTTKTDTWTSPSTAPTTKSDTWPSPSTAPATQNDSQAWSSSHMKRHFQCAQKQMSPSKLTKYCACHAKWPSNIWQKFAENSWNVISNARPIRDRSETVPRPFRAWSETVCVSPQPATQPRLLFALRTNGLYWKIQHFALRLSFQISPSPAPTTKSATWTSPSTAPTTQSDTWTSPSTAPTTKSDTWPSPSTAPATQNDSRL